MNYSILKATEGLPIVVTDIKPTGTQTRRAMGEDVVDMEFSVVEPINLEIGNTIDVYGQTYKLNRPASVTKRSKRQYDYVVQFEALFYDLAKVQFRGLGATNQLTEAEFTIMASAATIIDLIVRNANRLYGGWQIGVVDDTEIQNFVFSGQNCLQVLNQSAEAFQSEFWIDNQVIHFQRREQFSGLTLSYGKGNGLYELRRSGKNDSDLVTRLYVEGGSRNLPEGYGKTRLQLPASKRPYLQVSGATEIIEATQVFENIIPERVGTITGINASDIFEFSDTSLDFDVNAQLMPGVAAKVGFQTGSLAGYEFEIDEYNHATKTFKILLKTDEKAYPDGLPNDTLKPAVGDKYTLFDIQLPAAYVTDAENRLDAAGQAYLDKYSVPQFDYEARLTPIWVKQTNPTITLGYTVQLEDVPLGIDKEIRIGGYIRDLQEPNTYELELTDTISIAEIVRQYAQQERILYAIQTAGLLDPEQMRKSLFLNRLSERNGYLYLGADKIKAGYADDADKWDGMQFADYLNQPVRTGDSPRFEGVSSPVFVSGFSGHGYRVSADNGNYNATFDNLTVRKSMKIYELVVNQIKGSNGAWWVSDSAKLDSVTSAGSLWNCWIDSDDDHILQPFRIDDIVRCQRWDGRNVKFYVGRVVVTGEDSFSIIIIEGTDFPESGDHLVRTGNFSDINRQGAIYLTSSDDNAPYIDVIDGVTSASFANKTKVRLGKLTGIVDANMGALSGYGLYAQNAYITGMINVTGGNAATQTYAQSQASAAQAAAISAAAADATSKANNARTQAISSAATDATNKADAAQAAAISAAQTYANSVAQSKADIAQAAAISAASADATAKADNARTLAETYSQQLVASVQIGAVNLFGSHNLINAGITSSAVAYHSQYRSYYIPVSEGDIITVSRTNMNNDRFRYAYTVDEPLSNMSHTGLNTKDTATEFTITVPSGVNYFIVMVSVTGMPDTKFKAEHGNKRTDWSPAPEDVQAAINDADAKALAAQTAYNNLTASLKSMAYKDVVQLADLGTTLIQGGKIVTTLLDAAYIRANIVNAAYINTLELDASVIKSGTISENVTSLVKNPAVTGSIAGWSGSGLSYYTATSFHDTPTGVLRCSSSGNATIYSDWFDVDPAKIYEITLWMHANTTGHRKYFGIHATDTVGGTSNNIAVEPITNSGELGSDSTNLYFWNSTASITWRKMTCYILPSNFNPADAAGIGLNVTYPGVRLKPTTKRVRLRWLNYENDGTSHPVYVANPSVVEVSEQQVAFAQMVRAAANTADSKAVAAQSTANTANSRATTGINDAAAAQSAANLANTRIGNTTIISGGKILTGLLNADWIQSTVVTASYINTLSLNASAIKVGTLSGARINGATLNITEGSMIGTISIDAQGRLVNRTGSGGFAFDNQSNPSGGYKGVIAGASLSINTVMSIENNTTTNSPVALALRAQSGTALRLQAGDLRIDNGKIIGFGINHRSLPAGTYFLSNSDDVVIATGTGGYTFNLPSSPNEGKVIFYFRAHSSSVNITFGGNGNQVCYQGTVSASRGVAGYGGMVMWNSADSRWYIGHFS